MSEMVTISVVTPTGLVYEGNAASVILPAEDGYMEFRSLHATLITPMGHGILTLKTTGGAGKWIYINGGYAEIHENQLIILADNAENGEDIDPERAQRAYDRAQKRILDPEGGKWDIERARASLQRAEFRLNASRKTKEGL